jgi:hypothetical protein
MVFHFFAHESKDLSKEQPIVIQELVTAYNQFANRTHVIPNLDQDKSNPEYYKKLNRREPYC